MDSAYIERWQVIERYVQGRLTPEELTAFEIYMLEHPEAVDDVEYAKGLQSAMLAARDDLLPRQTAAKEPRRGFWLGPRHAAVSAVLVVAAVLGSTYLLQENAVLRAEIEQLRAPVVAGTEVWLENMRGAQSLLIEKSPGEGLWLRVLLDSQAQSPFEVEIRGVDSGFGWSRSGVLADEESSLRIAAMHLDFGRYELTVRSEATSRVAGVYGFEIVAVE